MPHKCTKCENIFKDGAAIILDGCPRCGWNKFLYVRDESIKPELPGKKADTQPASIPEAASKFIKEVNELREKKESPETAKQESGVKGEVGSRVESVRILSQGSYELNLESLLERDEIVMALKEDGSYVLHLPSVFQKKKR
ncbi:MAG: Zn-ribbon domain-containing protein [Candidatus Methanoperedens sp.]|nr:Zn-ribbon domain-containing protein [Candidatus Methanoperedens sp.]